MSLVHAPSATLQVPLTSGVTRSVALLGALSESGPAITVTACARHRYGDKGQGQPDAGGRWGAAWPGNPGTLVPELCVLQSRSRFPTTGKTSSSGLVRIAKSEELRHVRRGGANGKRLSRSAFRVTDASSVARPGPDPSLTRPNHTHARKHAVCSPAGRRPPAHLPTRPPVRPPARPSVRPPARMHATNRPTHPNESCVASPEGVTCRDSPTGPKLDKTCQPKRTPAGRGEKTSVAARTGALRERLPLPGLAAPRPSPGATQRSSGPATVRVRRRRATMARTAGLCSARRRT
jgi:hypothetical protein